MNNPTVSVVIPSYNHEKYVEETIKSILNQTFQDFEIIITDDGSSDNTVEVIKKFSDQRIKLFVFEENKGACKALNNCIINSKGKYIAYVSSDDAWEPYKLEKQVKFLDENPQIAAVFTKVKIMDENGYPFTDKSHPYYSVFDKRNRSSAEWLRRFFFKGNCLCHPSALIRREIYDEVGFYNENMANYPDLDMWVRICLKYNIFILDEKLTKFRVRDNEANVSGVKPQTRIRSRFENKQIFDHYLRIEDVDYFLRIFPDAQKYGTLKSAVIPYFLGRIAYDTNSDIRQLWGLEVIYNFMKSGETVDILEKDYNFQYSNFLGMSAEADIFKIFTHPEKDRLIRNKDTLIRENDRLIRNKDTLIREKDALIREKNSVIKEKNKFINALEKKDKQFKQLNSQISKMTAGIYEMQYRDNKGRSFSQKLISAIPSLYILFNANETGIKNALVNIKGYKSIKKDNLVDIGFYLKNNNNVRLSGMDPILHYMYHGFKEGKEPNSSFDGNYYLKKYKNVKKSNLNPLVHYSLYGKKEGKIISAAKAGTNAKNSKYSIDNPKSRGIRTLFFSHDLKMQGAQNSLYEMVIGLKDKEVVNPIVYSPNNGPLRKAYEKNGVKVITGNSKLHGPNSLEEFNKNIYSFIKKLEKYKIQFIHANTLRTFYGIEIARKMKIPCSWNPRESEPWETYFDYLPEQVKTIALDCFSYPCNVIFVSNYTKEIWDHLNNDNFITIHNALNTERLTYNSANWTREEARVALGIKENEIVIIQVGTVSERKGQKDIIQSISNLPMETVDNIKVFIIGDKSSEYSKELHDLYSKLPSRLREAVSIIPETTEENEFFKVIDYYLAADILVFSSRIESYPRVILEAIHFNLPIITTPVFGVKEQVEEGVSALFYEPGDIKQLSSHLLKLIEDNNLRHKLKENTKKQLEKLSTHDEMLDKYGEIILNGYLKQK